MGSMSSKPQETLCLPPRRQEGEPGPPSKSKSLKAEGLELEKRTLRVVPEQREAGAHL